MVPEQDVGIDYFCELIENRSPSGKYFCVQVKSTKRFGNHWSGSIKKETLVFWLNQRYPVFLIVYEQASRNCYWASIEDMRQSLLNKLQSASRTVKVKVDRSHLLEENGDNIQFIRKIKKDSTLVNALHGVPEFISAGGYVGSIPVLSLTDAMRVMIREKIRLGMDYLIYDYILKDDQKNAYQLSRTLTKFDHGHYDHFLIHARICRHLKKYEEAEENYDAAINICKDDPNWDKRKGPQDPSIGDIIAMVEDEKAKFKLDPKM
jgi:tetratricopeptide (TPR) repeat protein